MIARSVLALVLFGTALLGGCATGRAPLPVVTPEQLPDAWLEVLAAEPCPTAFRARVRMRVQLPDLPSVRLDGTLRADLPDRIRLSGKLGVFRPIFNLFVLPDSCEMLIHDETTYWVTPRELANWSSMNPSAWGEVLEWALCPQGLISRFEPTGPGRVDGREWKVEGNLTRTPFAAELIFDRKNRSLRSILLRERVGAAADQPAVVSVQLREYQATGAAWIPTLLDFELPHPEGTLSLRVKIAGLTDLDAAELAGKGLVRPAGWRSVRGAGTAVFPIPEGASSKGAP